MTTSLRAATIAACPSSQRAELARTLTARAASRAKGKRADAVGKAFEAVVNDAFEALHHVGILAHWTWTGAPSKHVRRGSRIEMVPTGPAPCDVSALTRDSRAVIAEVKHSARYIDLHAGIGKTGHAEAGLQSHQRAQLDAYADAGAVAMLVVEVAGVRAVIPWEEARTLPGVGVTVARAWAQEIAQGVAALCGHAYSSDASGRPDGAVAARRGGGP